MKQFIGVVLFFSLAFNLIAFLVSGLEGINECSKIAKRFKHLHSRSSTTTVEKLIIKPLATLMFPGMYLGSKLVEPGICSTKE